MISFPTCSGRILAVALMMAIASCGSGQSSEQASDPPAEQQHRRTASPDVDAWAGVFESHDNMQLEGDPVKIDSAVLTGEVLSIALRYEGGCAEHDFRLSAWSRFELSAPPHGRLYLVHDAMGDTCSQPATRRMNFSLEPLLQTYRTERRYAGPVELYIYTPGDTVRPAAVVTVEV